MRQLFDREGPQGSYTWPEEASEIENTFVQLIQPFVDRLMREGVCPRDLTYVLNSGLDSALLSTILGMRMKDDS